MNCAKQQFVSYTSNLLHQMYDFQNAQYSSRRGILNLQDLERSQSLDTVPLSIAWQQNPHNNIVCIHMHD